jgi:hypothetical protein
LKTKVREVSHKGSSSVVEWEDDSGNLNRSILPSTEIIKENGELFVEDVEDGYPYGVDWESLIHTRVGPKGIANLLRKNGIWDLEDYAQNTRVVTSVFNEACTANLQQFKEAVLRHGKEE